MIPQAPDELASAVRSIDSPAALADLTAGFLDIGPAEKQELLETFDVKARLEQRRPLVGETTMEELFDHSHDYRRTGDQYRPDADVVGLLQGVGEGYRVRVVFGSWCHVCTNFLPRGLKVQEALADSGIEFEYYGLPSNPWDPPHPEVARLEVRSLPTAIVYQGDKEIGRYAGGDEWQRPESKLWAAIRKTKR